MNKTHLIFAALTLFLLSSCSTFQYVTLEDDVQARQEKDTPLIDSLEISYAFTGDGGIISIEIRNNSTVPILVDKSKSALIKGEKSISFWEDVSKLKTVSQGQSLDDSNVYYTDSYGEITKDKSILFIPPDTKGMLTGPAVQTSFIAISPDQKTRKVNLPTSTGAYRAQITNFSEEESPAKYRLFLTVTSYGSQSKPVFINKALRVSSITNCSLSPNKINTNSKNQFYIRKLTGFGNFLGGVATIGALGSLLILATTVD